MNQEVNRENTQPAGQPSSEIKTKCCCCNKNHLIRALFMILFLIVKCLVTVIFYFVVAFQFIFVLFKKEPNQPLLDFNQSLSSYIYQIFLFVGYNTETKPFPFSSWPKR